MPEKKAIKTQTGNPPAGRLTSVTYTRETFMRDLGKVAAKQPPKK